MSNTVRCARFQEDVVGLLEGNAPAELRDHVASCDACRDASHELTTLSASLAHAGDDFVLSAELDERLDAVAREAAPRDLRTSQTRLRTAGVAPSKRPRKKLVALVLAAACSVTASAALGVVLADRQRSPEAIAQKAWRGKVTTISRSGADKTTEGLSVVTSSGKTPLAEGQWVKAGMKFATDGKTRARIDMEDGSFVVLDRATEVSVEDAPRTLRLNDGAVLADVAHVDNAPSAKILTPSGDVKILGTKLAVTATPDRTNVEVLRGEVEVASGSASHKVSAGQEGVIGKDGRVDVAPANDLAQRAAFGEQLIATHNEDTEAPASGLGELRAKKPGQQNEKDSAVRLAKHDVKIRIAGNVARTEIDETFANDTDEELEGIFRFPLPPAAQIERLALEVDGKLLDGEFLDKAKASAIWRGAIQNAAPRAPRPKEEIVWVPGPWHDPALLEWQRGGRFELRIFPIPKRGSRRVVIAYTESVAPVSGIRRYVYPLPQGASSKITVDSFTVDAQVVGHDGKTPVKVRGYELEKKGDGATERFAATMTSFTPSGDLAIEYTLDDKGSEASSWTYRAPPVAASNTKEADPIGNDPFVAIALRPKLPKWADAAPRDQVIVVDTGRTMFGERFARAKRLAVQMAQEMDRRDRLSVLACDVTCRAMPGGFLAPGAPTAHDVDAFLAGEKPDGASDLVAAVRAAGKTSGHDLARDLRVVVLSDGVATAGFRNPARVAAEAADALSDPNASVVTVPIGADADTTLLAELARGGGGVVVPYQPGQRLEATALEVLNATYGTTLRDVELVLPEGLREVAPSVLPPLRAGSETIVTARMSRDAVKGEIVLKGKVGGDPFEAKYGVDLAPTTDAANAFVPRLFAAARIADRERIPGDDAKAELIALSKRFAVPSKHTSLLVLESEAMFKAFGIERTEHAPLFTGEIAAAGKGGLVRIGGTPLSTEEPLGNALAADESEPSEKKRDEGGGTGQGFGAGFGRLGAGASTPSADKPSAPEARRSAPSPAATMAPPPASRPSKAAEVADPFSSSGDLDDFRRGRPGRFMKKIFVRRAKIATDATPAITAEKVEKARAAVAAAPDERGKHKELAKVLALSGQLEELGETLEKWSTRDPLDADVIVGRADLAARKGDRDASLRILSGALAANALTNEEATQVASAVARSFERLGRPEACAFRVTAAELKPQDNDAMARAIACERNAGRAKSADRWLAVMKEPRRKVVETAASKVDLTKPDGQGGDIVVTATWEGGVDLDLAIVDPAGRRAGVASRMRGARVESATSRDHETVALASGEGGAFVIEVVRASAATEGTTPVSGKLTVRAFGQTQTVPFTLTGLRSNVARVDAQWVQELVPVDDPGERLGLGSPAAFDRAAAAGALARISVGHCSAGGQVGTGHLTVTFAPTGRVSDVTIDDANFSGTPAGRCARAAFFAAAVPAFVGGPVRIGKTFTIR